MKKSTIKESIKAINDASLTNQSDLKTLAVLNPPHPSSSAHMLSQSVIRNNVNLYTKNQSFDLRLPKSQYNLSHTESGSHMLITNKNGYAAAYNNHSLDLLFEMDTCDSIYDSTWLHNELFFAAAHNSSLFIYNNDGAEQHAVRNIGNPRLLSFLPFHFLLSIYTSNARLKYLDTSTGKLIADLFVKDKLCTFITSNPTNGLIHLGGSTGVVSLWAPSQPEYLTKIKCHSAAITGIAIERTGNKMITTGLDSKIQQFDIRNTFKPIRTIKLNRAAHLSEMSAKNMLAISNGNKIMILKEYEQPYLTHRVSGDVTSLRFNPFQDILSVGHTAGLSNMIVPGCGDQNYDSLETTPFMTKRQRQELEIKRLMEKIPYDLIAQDTPLLGIEKNVEIRQKVSERYYNGDREEKRGLARFKKEY